MSWVKTVGKLAGETILFGIVGALLWMAIGMGTVNTYSDGTWDEAGFASTFIQFVIMTGVLYLLFRLVQWVLGLIARKTAKTVDSALQDVEVYTAARDRVFSTLEIDPQYQRTYRPNQPIPPQTPSQPNQPAINSQPDHPTTPEPRPSYRDMLREEPPNRNQG
jgi:hypothetical protein